MLRVALVAGFTLVVGCGSTGEGPSEPLAADARCGDRGELAPDATCLGSVTATLVDERAAPVADVPITVCGDGCVYGRTDPNGRATIAIDAYLRRPSLMVHGRSRVASWWLALDRAGDVDLGTLVAPRMPSKVPLPVAGEGGAVTSGEVTLEIAHDASIALDVIELQTPEEQGFSAARVPLESAPPWARGDAKLLALYALTPFATVISPGAKVRIENRLGLAPDTPVELWIHGGDDRKTPMFAKAGGARVTSDGAAIVTDDAAPLPQIGWIGVRAR